MLCSPPLPTSWDVEKVLIGEGRQPRPGRRPSFHARDFTLLQRARLIEFKGRLARACEGNRELPEDKLVLLASFRAIQFWMVQMVCQNLASSSALRGFIDY